MYKYSEIRQIHLEITQKCQASCPMCDRNMNGAGVNPHIDLSELSLNDCRNIFEVEFIQQLTSMFMCGNLGDPIIAKESIDVFHYFRQNNPTIWLGMNTNGGARSKYWWKKLAEILGSRGVVTFSIDGLEDTNHIYRQNVNWGKVVENADAFIKAGGKAKWDYLIFEHNQHQVDTAEELSKKMGFIKFVAKKTGRFVNTNTTPKEEHIGYNKENEFKIKKPDNKYLNESLKKQNDLINQYASMDNYYDQTPIECKILKDNSLFISAEGLALPCCWTAGRMYKWWNKNYKVEQIWDFIDQVGGKERINAKYGLQKVFDSGIFNLIQDSWNKPSCSSGKLKVCAMKCGVGFDPFSDQFK